MQNSTSILNRAGKPSLFHLKRIDSRASPSLATFNGNICKKVSRSLNSRRAKRHILRNAAVEDEATIVQSESGYLHLNPEPPKQWSVLSPDVSIGPCPRSPSDLEELVQETKITALLFLETPEECANMGLDWERFQKRATDHGVIAVRISMKEDDCHDQVSSLPEAVRVLATFSALGYKVHVSCTTGVYSSPLVALGYLTFVSGMEVDEAMDLIKEHCPAAEPALEAWEQVKANVGSGNMKRISELALQISNMRSKPRGAEDWLDAQKKYISEAFQRSVDTEINVTSAVSKAESLKATKHVLDELASTRKEVESLGRSTSYTKDRIEFYSRQVEVLKKREMATKSNFQKEVRERESLKRQVETLLLKEEHNKQVIERASLQVASLTAKVAAMSEREESLRVRADLAAQQVQQLKVSARLANEKEAEARKELSAAEARLEAISAKFTAVQASLEESLSAKEEAKRHVLGVTSQIRAVSTSSRGQKKADPIKVQELEKERASAVMAASHIEERLQFLHRQERSLRSKEEAARLALDAANAKLAALVTEMKSAKEKEAAEHQKAVEVNREVISLKQQVSSLQESLVASKQEVMDAKAQLSQQSSKFSELSAESGADLVQQLRAELEAANRSADSAVKSKAVAEDRVAFMFRRMELLQQREAKHKKTSQERISMFVRQVAELKGKLAMADALAEVSQKRMDDLSVQVLALQKKEEEARNAAMAAGEKVQLFKNHAEELKRKESLAREAAMAASEKAKLLEVKVLDLERREAHALAQSQKFSENIGSLIHINTELGIELEEAKEREEKLEEALEEGMSMLTVALEADQTIQSLRMAATSAAKELTEERLRAERLASELEMELAYAEKQTLAPAAGMVFKSESAASQDMDDQHHLAKLAFSANSMISTSNGAAMAVAVEKGDNHFTLLRNLALGAIAAAAVPLTLTALISGNPQMGDSAGAHSNYSQSVQESVCDLVDETSCGSRD